MAQDAGVCEVTTAKELRERLNKMRGVEDDWSPFDDIAENAIDALEAAEAENERLRSLLVECKVDYCDPRFTDRYGMCERLTVALQTEPAIAQEDGNG